jgi:hypothetical protein
VSCRATRDQPDDACGEWANVDPLLVVGLSSLSDERPLHHQRLSTYLALETMQERLDRTPNAMRLRRQTVEHVFGTL